MKTKKLILVIFLTFIGAIGAYAQKTNVRMQETQARLCHLKRLCKAANRGVADRQIERTHQRRMDAHQRTSRTGDEWRPGQHPQLCNLYVFAKT